MVFRLNVKSYLNFDGYGEIVYELIFMHFFKLTLSFWLVYLFWLCTFIQFFIAVYTV